MVTGGKSLKKFHELVCEDCKPIKLTYFLIRRRVQSVTYFIMIFAFVHFVLSHLPNFNSMSGVSLAASVMPLSYSTIAWAASMSKGVREDVEYGYKEKSTVGMVFNFFSGLGDKPSKGPMWKGVIVAYIIVALSWLIATANIFVVIHVIGSYQIYAMPVFEMMETLLVKKLNFRPTTILRFCVRSFYVAATMFLGMTFPIFGGLLAFFGGFAFAPTTYFIRLKYGLSWWANWVCIAFGIFLMVLSPIGELRTIVIQAKEYQFYS
ncbi:unnamed protein product [Brassica rapa]|uniref:Amino acid transporter transmembrane domain-containing protein n=1 Tax=Brassica campestris TaxID=3711 RepID=A0A8D9LT98_BRACM|nr:unnamed protein product [Brassica rapa]